MSKGIVPTVVDSLVERLAARSGGFFVVETAGPKTRRGDRNRGDP